MTCTEDEDPYSSPEEMRDEEKDLLRQLVDKAKERASLEAYRQDWGPKRTEAYINQQMLEARNAAHDRFILQQIKDRLSPTKHAPVPLPNGVERWSG